MLHTCVCPSLGGEDYRSTTRTNTFSPDNLNSATQFVRVSIIGHDVVELRETFLGVLATTDDRVILNPNTTTVTILDADSMPFILILL